jgi:D-alanyl-D-alanine carboxypeptidase/D-alanyl-D-alanine-endopeptidase (penicillin-binding protein 4)
VRPQLCEQAPQCRELAAALIELVRKGRELVRLVDAAVTQLARRTREPLVEPQRLGLDRQGLGIAVGEQALELADVVVARGRAEDRIDAIVEGDHRLSILGQSGPKRMGRATHSSSLRVPGHNPGVRRGFIVIAALVLLIAPLARAGVLPLPTRLAHALEVRGIDAGRSGAVAVDLTSGNVVFARNPDLSLAPASNEKLPVTFAALQELGPTYRFHTDVLGTGRLVDGVWHGNLVVKGFGDPTLTTAKLDLLVRRMLARGIRSVDGRILGDESWFDTQRTAPGWKSSYYMLECPPLSALSVDQGWYDNHYAVRPALAAAGTFKHLLRVHGVPSGPAAIGKAPASATVLATVRSRTLLSVLRDMDHESDNFDAELLLKELGAEKGGAGSSGAGAAVVRRALAAAGIPLTGVVIADGSGLSLDDRVTASALTALLVHMWNDETMRGEVWSMLPVAGINGTLVRRMRDTPAQGQIRAKTGTTDEASALSGYARERYAFAVIQNGSPVSDFAAREAQDRFATALVKASAP